jgi:sugar lactone lactonase YvrE
VTASPPRATITGLDPSLAIAGGRVTLRGDGFGPIGERVPMVRVGTHSADVLFAARDRLAVRVPEDLEGLLPVRLDDTPGTAVMLDCGTVVARGVHQVDSPAVGVDGTVYLTCSGSRGQQTPVSVYRVGADLVRDVFVTGITNATSLAFGPDGRLYVSSRFDGTVSRIDAEGRAEIIASELGIACGLAFAPDGTMFVGDRTGTVFRVLPSGETTTLATLPPSIAAYHLAVSDDRSLYVTGPTLAPRDYVYRIGPDGDVSVLAPTFGRPQGLAVARDGQLYVVEALAGVSGLYRLDPQGRAELVLSAPGLVGVAFDPRGGLVVATGDTAWKFTKPLR